MKSTSVNDGLCGIWRDLTEEPAWKYEELPPLLLAELTEVDLFEVGDTELARAHWFWSRPPKLALQESAMLLVMAFCVLLCLAFAFAAWPGMSMLERVAEMIILLLELALGIYLIVQRVKIVRWRREYELSIDRLIRTSSPGYDGGPTSKW